MFKNVSSYLPVFAHLLYADILVFKPSYKDRLIDFFLFVSITVFVMGYLLTKLGMRADFGMFTAATNVAVAGLFDIFPRALTFVGDITGNKVISYEIILPIPSWMAVTRIGVSDGLRGLSLAIFAMPFALPFTWEQFNFTNFSCTWFVLILLANSLLCGFFGVFLASIVSSMAKLESMWMRVIFPLWTLGCCQFTWHVLYETYPTLAYLTLLNPFMYPMEGMRAAVLGQAGSLPMWLCFSATMFFALLYGIIGVRNTIKRLDCV